MKTTYCSNHLSGTRFANCVRIAGAVIIAAFGFALLNLVSAQDQLGAPRPDGPPPGDAGSRRPVEPPSPETIADRLLQRFDGDADGLLSRDELIASLKARRESRPAPGDPSANDRPPVDGRPGIDAVVARMLETADADGNGQLSRGELSTALEARRREGPGGSRPGFGDRRPGRPDDRSDRRPEGDGRRPGAGFGARGGSSADDFGGSENANPPRRGRGDGGRGGFNRRGPGGPDHREAPRGGDAARSPQPPVDPADGAATSDEPAPFAE